MLSLLPLLQVNCEIKIRLLIQAMPKAKKKSLFSIFIQTYRLSFKQQSAACSVKTVNRLLFPLSSLFSWSLLCYSIFFSLPWSSYSELFLFELPDCGGVKTNLCVIFYRTVTMVITPNLLLSHIAAYLYCALL